MASVNYFLIAQLIRMLTVIEDYFVDFRWNLRPKMKALQTQPTVSPTLIHHIQRQEIKVVPNVQVRNSLM